MPDANVAESVDAVSDTLCDLETTLHESAAACERMADSIVPPGGAVSLRYRRAAGSWPTAAAPSYERFGSALAVLHDTVAALRSAAARCRSARSKTAALR